MELTLWSLLYGGWGPPRRAAAMNERRNAACKYIDLENYTFTPALLDDHYAGRETYAATLSAAGVAWCGCKDYDDASEAEILAALDAARAAGVIAVAIIMPGNRAHIWTFYDRPYPIADIRAQLRRLPRKGSGEIYPSGNPIRLPFGYHKIKKTRGILVLQDGRRFTLDNPAGLSAGLAALLTLPRNSTPDAAPAGERDSSGQAWGDAYKPEEWNDLPAGGPLWRSPYIARAASTRPDLAKLIRNERVTLVKQTGERDDTDSAQVAALAYNLSSADIDRQQARAIADYLKPQLRPGKVIEHYRAHFDAEWERYKPAYYTGRLIRILGPAEGDAPQALPQAQHKSERTSRARKDRPQKVAGALGYLEWLKEQIDPQSDTVMLSQRQCAERLGCNVRTIKRYEQQLKGKIERRAIARRQAGCLFILVTDVVPTSLVDVVIADVVVAQPVAENAVPVSMQEEHTAPVAPTPPASLKVAVYRAIRAIEPEGIDQSTGEIKPSRTRATPKRVWAYIADRWPDLDMTDAEEVYANVRKTLQTQRKKAKDRAYWHGERLRVGSLDNDQLLVALGGWASRLAAAEGKRPGSGWAKRCAALFAIHDDERRKRGLSAVEAPTDRASRKAATDRTVKVAQALSRPPDRPDRATGAVQLGFGHLIADPTMAALRAQTAQAHEGTASAAGVLPPPAAAPDYAQLAVGIADRLRGLKAAQRIT